MNKSFKLWHRDRSAVRSVIGTAAAIAIGLFAALLFWIADLLGQGADDE